MLNTERKSSSLRSNGKSTSVPQTSRCFDFQPKCRCSIYLCPHRSFSIQKALYLSNFQGFFKTAMNPGVGLTCTPCCNLSPPTTRAPSDKTANVNQPVNRSLFTGKENITDKSSLKPTPRAYSWTAIAYSQEQPEI